MEFKPRPENFKPTLEDFKTRLEDFLRTHPPVIRPDLDVEKYPLCDEDDNVVAFLYEIPPASDNLDKGDWEIKRLDGIDPYRLCGPPYYQGNYFVLPVKPVAGFKSFVDEKQPVEYDWIKETIRYGIK